MPSFFWNKEARWFAEGNGEYGAEETPEGLGYLLRGLGFRAMQGQVEEDPDQDKDYELT